MREREREGEGDVVLPFYYCSFFLLFLLSLFISLSVFLFFSIVMMSCRFVFGGRLVWIIPTHMVYPLYTVIFLPPSIPPSTPRFSLSAHAFQLLPIFAPSAFLPAVATLPPSLLQPSSLPLLLRQSGLFCFPFCQCHRLTHSLLPRIRQAQVNLKPIPSARS